MDKQRLAAVVIGGIMLLSTVGVALSFSTIQTRANAQPQQTPLPPAVNTELTPQQMIAALQAGRLVYTYQTPADCTDCVAAKDLLTAFAAAHPDLMTLLLKTGTPETLSALKPDGKIAPLALPTDEEKILEFHCANTLVQPKECLLLKI